MSPQQHQECYKGFKEQYETKQIKHFVCPENQYMIVRMEKSEEADLKKFNEKNQAFTRVAKYIEIDGYIIVLLFSSYKFNVSP